jgi:hypothetical protein
LQNSSHLAWILKKDKITKKQPFAKFQPFATKLSHIHHFPHLHLDDDNGDEYEFEDKICWWALHRMIVYMPIQNSGLY